MSSNFINMLDSIIVQCQCELHVYERGPLRLGWSMLPNL